MSGVVTEVIHSQVYELLKTRILTAQAGFRPGNRCNVTRIAKELGVSVTPVKEALKRLESEGLVNVYPRSGTYIAKLDPRLFHQTLVVRRKLEEMIIDMIAEEIVSVPETIEAVFHSWEEHARNKDVSQASLAHMEFHTALVRMTQNEVLVELYEHLLNRSSIYVAYHSNRYIIQQSELQLHRDILESAMRRDRERFLSLLQIHYEKAEQRILPNIT